MGKLEYKQIDIKRIRKEYVFKVGVSFLST